MREPEGIETPPPGKSSERAWSKHREPYFRSAGINRHGEGDENALR